MKTYIYYLERGGIPFYIGKTNKPSNRQNSHRAKRNDFTLKLHTLDLVNKNEWKFWENHYISLFKSWGFILENKNNGGGGTDIQSMFTKLLKSNKLKGKPKPLRTKEHCLKLSQSTKGHLTSEETKNKISQSSKGISRNKGRISPNKGKIMSDNQKQKISLSQIGKIKLNSGGNKPIKQYTLDGHFIADYISLSEAYRVTKVPQTGISLCCNNKRISSGGFKWSFLN
jgi:hypothetical protein